MTDRTQTVHQAIMLLCSVGNVNAAQAYTNMKLYRADMVLELSAALEERVELRVRMVQADIARCDEVMDALLCATIE